LISYGALILSRVELLKVEFTTGGLAAPQTEIVGGSGVVSWNRHIVCNGLHELTILPDTLCLGALFDMTI
jgi:hypothetical protein